MKLKNDELWWFKPTVIFVIILSFVIDVLIKMGIIPSIDYPVIAVNGNYIYYIFSSVITMSAIWPTVMTLAGQASSQKVLNLTVKEMYRYEIIPSLLKGIGVIIYIDLAAIACLATDFFVTMTGLAIILLVYVIKIAGQTWSMLMDKGASSESIIKNIDRILDYESTKISNNQNIITLTIKWFDGLEESIKRNDEDEVTNYLFLLKKTRDKCEDYSGAQNKYENCMHQIFPLAVGRWGIVDAYKKMVLFENDDEISWIFGYELINEIIEPIKYYDNKEIVNCIPNNFIDDIIRNFPGEDYKVGIICQYFNTIFENVIIDKNTKNSLLEIIIKRLCNMDSKNDVLNIECKVLLNIYKVAVIENKETGKEIYLQIIDNLYSENRLSGGRNYAETIGKLLRLHFFYAFYEDEIKMVERNRIGSLFLDKVESMDCKSIGFGDLFGSYETIDMVVETLIEFAISEGYGSGGLEFIHKSRLMKNAVWTIKNKIIFAFYFYCASTGNESHFPLVQALKKADIGVNDKQTYCHSIISLFKYEKDGMVFCDKAQKEIDNLKKISISNGVRAESFIQKSFDEINEYLIELNRNEQIPSPIFSKKEMESFIGKFADNHILKFDAKISLDQGEEFIAPARYVNLKYKDNKDLVDYFYQEITKNIIDSMIRETLPEVKLTFDLEGIKLLLNELKSKSITKSNYRFDNDFAISAEDKQSEEFNQLKKEMENIFVQSYREFGSYVMINTDDIKFNMKIVESKYDELSKAEKENYASEYKIAEDRYQIEGIYYSAKEILEYIDENIRIKKILIKVATNLSHNDGFWVTFNY